MLGTGLTARAAAAVFAIGGLAASGTASAEPPSVVASIKPVHSLVASVMKGVGTPYLLIKGGGSPHTYALRPSEARRLGEADMVFWIGKELEAFLEKPLSSLSGKARLVALHDAKGVRLLKTREGGAWEPHDHDHRERKPKRDRDQDHEHDEKAERDHRHEHGKKSDHDHDNNRARKGRDDHAHGQHDMHVWLDPHNAEAMVRAIAAALVKADPDNAGTYRRNAAATVDRLEALGKQVDRTLAPVRNRKYLVFHDAYQYLEKRYRLAAAGSVTLDPQRQPGAKRLYALRKRIVDGNIRCVFVEPQFPPKIVNTLIQGTPAKKAVLDPLGASIEEGPDAYFTLLRNLASSLHRCLAS